ncbi:hypothetical protein NKH36_33055 [Mesorhizobium sp. M1312]|uniref:maleate cis-trans isomerase family protein n=1 Tax=unclassified Mesorhizobium TaxID=325217 RepID=UPI00333B3F5E
MVLDNSPKRCKRMGAMVPSDNKIPYELRDDKFISNWLADRNLGSVEYISTPTRDDALYNGVDYYARLADEDVLSAAARQLRKQGCDSVVWACTSASFFKGVPYAHRQIQLLSDNAAAPATNTSMAFLAALDVLGAKRVDVMLPYSPEIAKLLVSFLSEVGISVGTVWHMSCPASGEIFDIDCEAELTEFVSTRPFSDDPILVPCTSISSLTRVETFEKISGRSVLTANQVTIWHALVLAGMKPNILDCGSFLRSYAKTGDRSYRLPLER